jgi:hypothetical protein
MQIAADNLILAANHEFAADNVISIVNADSLQTTQFSSENSFVADNTNW